MDALGLIGGALGLSSAAFRTLLDGQVAPLRLGLFVTFFGGLSLAVGQSVALFALRVSRRRLGLSLVLQAALYLASFLVWTWSVWLVGTFGFGGERAYVEVAAAIGLAHAPQLLGLLALAPYFGVPLQGLLNAWTLVATLVATTVLFDISPIQSTLCVAGGWLLVQLAQRLLGRPFTSLGVRLRRAAAGTDLRPPMVR